MPERHRSRGNTIARQHARCGVSDPKYAQAKATLDRLIDEIETALSSAKATEQAWREFADGHAKFATAFTTLAKPGGIAVAGSHDVQTKEATPRQESNRLEELSPTSMLEYSGDLEGATGATMLVRHVRESTNASSATHSHATGYECVRKYLSYCKGVQDRHQDVASAHVHCESLKMKAQTLEAKHQASEKTRLQVERTRERLELAKTTYRGMVARMIEYVDIAIEKRNEVVALLRISFWLQQARLLSVAQQVEQTMFDSAKAGEVLLLTTSISNSLPSPNTMFNAMPRP